MNNARHIKFRRLLLYSQEVTLKAGIRLSKYLAPADKPITGTPHFERPTYEHQR
jgi:hypothetical protein